MILFSQVVSMLSESLLNIVGWFSTVLESSGMLSFYMAAVFLVLLDRFILHPLFRSTISAGASDTVRNFKRKSN